MEDLHIYPGGDLVERGLDDLSKGLRTEESLLVLVAGPRLRRLGLSVEEVYDVPKPYEHALYSLIEARSASPHSDYNALIGRVTSFADAYSVTRGGK